MENEIAVCEGLGRIEQLITELVAKADTLQETVNRIEEKVKELKIDQNTMEAGWALARNKQKLTKEEEKNGKN